MKRNQKKSWLRLAAGALCACMLCSVGALAAQPQAQRIRFDTYDSQALKVDAGGRTYSVSTTLYYAPPRYKTGVWIIADSSVPGGTMSARAYLYDRSGSLMQDTPWVVEETTTHFLFVETDDDGTSDPYVASSGEFRIRHGGSVMTSGDTPKLIYDDGDVFEAARARTAQAPDSPRAAYPVNSRGMTYGSLLLAYDIGEKPDLIAAVGTEGQQGYVLREDFDPQFYTQEAARAYAQHLKQDNLIPLYSLDGERIGSYALGTAGRAEETDPVTQARLEKLSAQQPAAELEPLQPYQPLTAREQAALQDALVDGAYPTTPKGETYGPRMARYLVGYEPDLIAVVGDEGMRGYVRRSEYQWASYGGGVLEVYDLKGAVIDQFTVDGRQGK